MHLSPVNAAAAAYSVNQAHNSGPAPQAPASSAPPAPPAEDKVTLSQAALHASADADRDGDSH
jgi:hypothetical protein